MRFCLLDRIIALEPDTRISAIKNLAMTEEYLADHFPAAPVMPGVLMLEALVQTAAWLVRSSEDFAHSMVHLKEVRGVKYASFVEPGQTLQISAEQIGQDERESKFKAQGTVDGAVAVSARLTLARCNLAEHHAAHADTDAYLRSRQRELFSLLYRPQAVGGKAS